MIDWFIFGFCTLFYLEISYRSYTCSYNFTFELMYSKIAHCFILMYYLFIFIFWTIVALLMRHIDQHKQTSRKNVTCT